MKEIQLFEYTNRTSAVSKFHPSGKLIALLVYSIMCGIVNWYIIPAAALILVPVMIAAGRETLRQIPALWKILLFFAAFALIRFFNGENPDEAAAFFLRLSLMAAAAVVFYTTTGTAELAAGIHSLLNPIPFINGGRAAGIISAAAGFLPMIFRISAELSEAGKARGFTPRAGFIRYIKLTSLPLIISLLQKSEEMSDAYYSRCYTENRIYRTKVNTPGTHIYPAGFILLCVIISSSSFLIDFMKH